MDQQKTKQQDMEQMGLPYGSVDIDGLRAGKRGAAVYECIGV